MIEYTVKVYADGSKIWCLNGLRHRVDGPAMEYADGYKSWWFNGNLHRTTGPAVEWPDGGKEWWLNGINYTEQEFLEATPQLVKELTIAELEALLGHRVKVVK